MPAEHTFSLFTSPVLRDGPLYALPTCSSSTAPGCRSGTARAAIDAVVELAQRKLTIRNQLRDEAWVQTASPGRALLGGARGFLFDVVGDIWEALERGDPPSLRQRALLPSRAVGCRQKCTEVVNLLYQAGGGSSVYATSPLDRLLRDAHTSTSTWFIRRPCSRWPVACCSGWSPASRSTDCVRAAFTIGALPTSPPHNRAFLFSVLVHVGGGGLSLPSIGREGVTEVTGRGRDGVLSWRDQAAGKLNGGGGHGRGRDGCQDRDVVAGCCPSATPAGRSQRRPDRV